MAMILEHNVQTGEILEREETSSEKKARELREATMTNEMNAMETENAKKNAILGALSIATGFTSDELREALNA